MRTFPAGSETVTESDEIISVTWSWTSKNDDFPDVEHNLVWIKDETNLYFGTKNPEGRWVTMRVRNDRFRPSNLKQAREMATEFIGGTE